MKFLSGFKKIGDYPRELFSQRPSGWHGKIYYLKIIFSPLEIWTSEIEVQIFLINPCLVFLFYDKLVWLLCTFIYTLSRKAKADLTFWEKMSTNRGIKNGGILLLAPILALGLFFLAQNFSGMTASVLDLSELKTIKEQQRDLAYKTESQLFELFWTESLRGTVLNVELLYNPDKVQVLLNEATGAEFRVLHQESGVVQLALSPEQIRSVEEGWFQMPFSGEAHQLLLWSASQLISWTAQPLRVGNLNHYDQHSFLP